LKDEGISAISAIGIDEASIEKHDDLEDEGISAIGIDEASIDKHEELEDEGRSVKYFFGTTIEKARSKFSQIKFEDTRPYSLYYLPKAIEKTLQCATQNYSIRSVDSEHISILFRPLMSSVDRSPAIPTPSLIKVPSQSTLLLSLWRQTCLHTLNSW
jgi:hypothetical protein